MHHAQIQAPDGSAKVIQEEPMPNPWTMVCHCLLPAKSTEWDSLEPTFDKGKGIDESGGVGVGPEFLEHGQVCRLSLHSRGIRVLVVKWRQGAKQALGNEHKFQICSTAVFGRFGME